MNQYNALEDRKIKSNDENHDQQQADAYLALLEKVALTDHGNKEEAPAPSQDYGWTSNNESLAKDQEQEAYLDLWQRVAMMDQDSNQDDTAPSQGYGWSPNNGSLAKENGITFDADGNMQILRNGPLSSGKKEYLQQLTLLSKSPSAMGFPTHRKSSSEEHSEGDMATGQSTRERGSPQSSQSIPTTGPDEKQESDCSWGIPSSISRLKPYTKGIVGVVLLALITHCFLKYVIFSSRESQDWHLFRLIEGNVKTIMSAGWHKLQWYKSFLFKEDEPRLSQQIKQWIDCNLDFSQAAVVVQIPRR